MGAPNNFFNFRSAEYDQATTPSAGRLQELRERGWITASSTPAEIAAVEHTLAAQMRARVEVQMGRPWPYGEVVGGAVLGCGIMLALTATARGGYSVLAMMWLAVALACGIPAIVVYRRERRRDAVLARAVLVGDTCNWCGRTAPHTLEGEVSPPRVYHAVEIEDATMRGR
jgi:Flp pilus assembly protein TadB